MSKGHLTPITKQNFVTHSLWCLALQLVLNFIYCCFKEFQLNFEDALMKGLSSMNPKMPKYQESERDFSSILPKHKHNNTVFELHFFLFTSMHFNQSCNSNKLLQ